MSLVGDAELYEGSVWETLIFIAHHNINNLRIIVDRNAMGILGKNRRTSKAGAFKRTSLQALGLDVITVDGHNFDELGRDVFLKIPSRPRVMIANTIKGKGVSYMEDEWQIPHHNPKSKKIIEIGIKELS